MEDPFKVKQPNLLRKPLIIKMETVVLEGSHFSTGRGGKGRM